MGVHYTRLAHSQCGVKLLDCIQTYPMVIPLLEEIEMSAHSRLSDNEHVNSANL